MINEPVHVSDEAFNDVVLKSALPVIVDFWAPWCGPCKMVLPLLDAIAKKYAGKLIVAKINIDDYAEVASRYMVQSIPTLLFVRDGEVQNSHVGALAAADLEEMVEELIA